MADASHVEQPASGLADDVTFGVFRLRRSRRLLEKNGHAVPIGGRAFDLLLALIDSAPEVVNQDALVARAWPNAIVGEGNLRYHVAALRKAMGPDGAGRIPIVTVAGRGYSLAEPVFRAPEEATPPGRPRTLPIFTSTLPARLTRMVGRGDDCAAIVAALVERRFLSIVGPGGVGKTTVAVAVAHALRKRLGERVLFVDFGSAQTPSQVAESVLAALSLQVSLPNPHGAITGALSESPTLLVMDGCEHLVDPIAEFAERVFRDTREVSVLATSRESLGVEAERVHRLFPLAVPPEEDSGDAASVLGYPAAELFMERVAASGHDMEASQATTSVVAEICRRLDGIPLALELVASRVGVYGLGKTAELLDGHFFLRWRNRRTALARHQTLDAALSWSYDLLARTEQRALRQLSLFVGHFTLADARAVVGESADDFGAVQDSVAALVARSLLVVRIDPDGVRYRLLDVTRAYAKRKLAEAGETEAATLRYAEHLDRIMAGWSETETNAIASQDLLAEVRAALEWCFSPAGDRRQGVRLAAVSTRLFLKLALLDEVRRWTEAALDHFDPKAHGPDVELATLFAYSFATTLDGDGSQGLAALRKGLALAEQTGDERIVFQFLSGLHALAHRLGDLQASIDYARRCCEVAATLGDPDGLAVSHALLGVATHLTGDHKESRRHIQTALSFPSVQRLGNLNIGSDVRSRALSTHARGLWIQGRQSAARLAARDMVEDAEGLSHPLTLCMGLLWTSPIFLWEGDFETVDEASRRLAAESARAHIPYFQNAAIGLSGEVAIEAGRPEEGVLAIERALAVMRPRAFQSVVTRFMGALAEGRRKLGQLDEALVAAGEALANAEKCGDLFHWPDLLRIKGEILADGSDIHGAEGVLVEAVETARRQDALAFELRCAVSLARLRTTSKGGDARELLQSVYDRFDPDEENPDLTTARALLAHALSAQGSPRRKVRLQSRWVAPH
jgi:predicted ATPase/DNA-binding winged helix-turn-helix (wHTH) protein